MKRILATALLAALIAWRPLSLGAKDVEAGAEAAKPSLKPVAVVSMVSYERILNDLEFIGELSDNPDLPKSLEGTLNIFTQGEGLKGLDKKRPWGLVLSTDGLNFIPIVFLPVTDTKQLLQSISAMVGEAQDEGNGISSIKIRGQSAFVRQRNGWAFIGQSAEALANAPLDPGKLMGSLPRTYEVALRLYVRNIPEMFRTLAVDQLRAGMQEGLARKEGEEESDYELRKKMVENQVQRLTTAIAETDQLTIGWAFDKKSKSSALEVQVTALPGGKMARQFAQMKETATAFSGFLLPEAAATLNFSAKLEKQDAEEAATMIDGLRASALKQIDKQEGLGDEPSKAAAKEAAGKLFDAYKATVQAGLLDAGAALLLNEKKFTLVAGGFVADTAALESAIKKSINVLNKKAPEVTVKYDAAKHLTTRFHTITVPVKDDEKARQLLGDTLEIVIGIAPKSAYVAVGSDGVATLKKVMDQSAAAQAGGSTPKKSDPVRMKIQLQKILEFAAQLKNDPMTSMMADELAKSEGKDALTLTGRAEKNGVVYRLELQEGVLKLLGQAGKMASGAVGARAAR